MVASKWSVVLWSATFHACLCFNSQCLNGPSYPDDRLSVVACNSTSALLAWSLGQNAQKLSLLTFEYSCLNVSPSGLIPIVMNRTLPWGTDGSSGFTNIPLVPNATCLFSACYGTQGVGSVFLSPTGCLAAPSATSARSEVYITVSPESSASLVITDQLIATPALPLATKPASAPNVVNGINGITLGVTVGIAVVVFIVIATLGLSVGLYAIRRLERNAMKKELRIIGVGLAEKVDINYAPVEVAISKTHGRGMYFTSQTSALDSLEKPTKSAELDFMSHVDAAVSIQGAPQTSCSETQVEQRCFTIDTSDSYSGYTVED